MKQVLIVDDSAMIRKVARRILELMKCEVIEADDSQKALDLCAVSMPNGIFIDLSMPGMDGCQFSRNLRKMRNGDQPKVILCDSEYEEMHILRARHANADGYIVKPFDYDILKRQFIEVGLYEDSDVLIDKAATI